MHYALYGCKTMLCQLQKNPLVGVVEGGHFNQLWSSVLGDNGDLATATELIVSIHSLFYFLSHVEPVEHFVYSIKPFICSNIQTKTHIVSHWL